MGAHDVLTFILLTALTTSGCGPSPPDRVRTEPCDPEARAWILECVKNANPMSDEEPEENVAQCERTAVRLFCGPSCVVNFRTKMVMCHQPEH